MSDNLILGDCRDVLRTWIAGNGSGPRFTAIVTDPPAGIAFMGKQWDSDHGGRDAWIANMAEIAKLCLDLCLPGAHALVWALPRTSHWTATAWENGGWEVRDRIAHCFGSGFPKSLDVSKALDKAAGAEREVVGQKLTAYDNSVRIPHPGKQSETAYGEFAYNGFGSPITAPATDLAREWSGYGSALKPAIEDWWLLRKPLVGSIAENVTAYGCGAINVDGGRVGYANNDARLEWQAKYGGRDYGDAENVIYGAMQSRTSSGHSSGRFPAHLIHDGSAEVVGMFPVTTSPAPYTRKSNGVSLGYSGPLPWPDAQANYGDTGSAARFFACCPADEGDYDPLKYTAKSSRSERNSGLDSTRIVKYNVPIGGALCKDVTTELVASLQRVTSGSTLTWLIGESGASITGLCQSDTLSTTLTEISRITTSQILSLLTPSLISAFTQAVNCETANGGNLAANAVSSSELTRTTISDSTESVRGAELVVSQMLSTISDAENWKPLSNFHATVKPLSLLRYLLTLVRQPTVNLVLDPFMGSGSTGVAAAQLGIPFVGIEQDAEYYEIAKRRISAVKLPLLETSEDDGKPQGRFPANLIHDGSAEVEEMFPSVKGATSRTDASKEASERAMFNGGWAGTVYQDTGSAARFFKACPPDEDDDE